MRRTWIKLWVDQCLRGSMISELNPEQRWIFIGLVLMAGDSEEPGLIFGRKDEDGNLQGKPDAVLAYELGVDETSIGPAKAKMIEKGKIAVDGRGVISICNWGKYQSEYERQKPGRTKVRPSDALRCRLEGEVEGEGEEEKSKGDRKPAPGPLSGTPAKAEIDDIIEKWNRFADGHELPRINGVAKGSARERALLARIREGMDFEKVLRAVHEQPFLCGDNDRGWMVNFEWILKPANMVKILEGAYVREVRGRARDRQPEDPNVGGRR